MSTSFVFEGRRVVIPGAYSVIKSGIKNPALALEFGNTLIIDTGSGTGFGGGAGINGTLKSGIEAINTFDNVRDFRNFVRGGLWWLLGGPLFFPGGGASGGVSSLTYIKAATTVPAEIEVLFGAQEDSDSDTDSTNDGSVTVQVRDEGVVGNGVLTGDVLTQGYGAKVIAGQSDPTKFILQFWRGTYKGLDTAISNGVPFDGIAAADTVAELVVQSPEVSTVQELVTWMQNTNGIGYAFNQFFKLKTYTLGSVTDEILSQDLTNGYELAAGGTETFSASDLTDALDAIADVNYDFILADKWGADARHANNLAIQTWITTTAKIKPDLYVAAGSTIGEFNSGAGSSVAIAQAYNSQYVTVVHGGAKKIDIGGQAFKEYKSIYKAAVMLGREAGMEPQIPLTFKGLGIEGELHSLTTKEVTTALDEGVLVSRLDNGTFDVVKGINTLQNNSFLVNPDGTTHSKQLARIIRQLNKEIVVNARQQLLKKPNGSNRNTLSPEDVKAWLEGYLSTKTATDIDDNLILSFQNVTVEVSGDKYDVTYAFTPNFEVSFLVFTGVMIDPS